MLAPSQFPPIPTSLSLPSRHSCLCNPRPMPNQTCERARHITHCAHQSIEGWLHSTDDPILLLTQAPCSRTPGLFQSSIVLHFSTHCYAPPPLRATPSVQWYASFAHAVSNPMQPAPAGARAPQVSQRIRYSVAFTGGRPWVPSSLGPLQTHTGPNKAYQEGSAPWRERQWQLRARHDCVSSQGVMEPYGCGCRICNFPAARSASANGHGWLHQNNPNPMTTQHAMKKECSQTPTPWSARNNAVQPCFKRPSARR